MTVTETAAKEGYTLQEQYDNITDVSDPIREKVLMGEPVDWDNSSGGVVHFAESEFTDHGPVRTGVIQALERGGFLSFEQSHNQAPTIGEFVERAEELNDMFGHGRARLIGYIVTPDRHDCRITVTGVRWDGEVTDDVRREFVDRFGTGYEFHEGDDYLRRWHD